MKTKKMLIGWALAGMIGACFILIQCNNATNPPPPPPALELIYPKGGSGQSFQVGQTITIVWSIHDQNQVGSVGIEYSLDGGKTWGVFPELTHSFSYPDTSYQWTIDAAYASDEFIIKVYEYINNYPTDASKPFTITP